RRPARWRRDCVEEAPAWLAFRYGWAQARTLVLRRQRAGAGRTCIPRLPRAAEGRSGRRAQRSSLASWRAKGTTADASPRGTEGEALLREFGAPWASSRWRLVNV